jgi:hypothetical protein
MTRRSEPEARPETVPVLAALEEIGTMLSRGESEIEIRGNLRKYRLHPEIEDQILETARERGRS